jgi:oxygen-independent coproporphyrinogen-3 oxidase
VKNQIKRELFRKLQKRTGDTPDWGILTGVRPVKLAGELLAREGSEDKAREILIRDYYLTADKADLILNIKKDQDRLLTPSPAEAVGLYIGIPFCPTRCVYCSFPANQGNSEEISDYLEALHREITFTADGMRRKGGIGIHLYRGRNPDDLNGKTAFRTAVACNGSI